MSVSTRNTILAAAAAIALGGAAFAGGMGGGSGSGNSGGNGGMGHGVVIPGAGVGGPSFNPGAGMGNGSSCCGNTPKGQQVVVPGVNVAGPNVLVGTPNITVNQGNIAVQGNTVVNQGFTNQRNDQQFLSSGGGYYTPVGVAPSSLSGLNVDLEETYTDTITEQVPTQQQTCVDQTTQVSALRPVQAVCLDAKGTPHPASRPSAEQRVDVSFNGEIFRCMSGTTMQVILGDVNAGQSSFNNAEGFSCKKGEALVHRRGGQLTCAPQAPQRNCNERSLLRRNGPGIKLVQTTRAQTSCVPTTTTVMETRTRQVERKRPVAAAPIVFDGGVGQGVY